MSYEIDVLGSDWTAETRRLLILLGGYLTVLTSTDSVAVTTTATAAAVMISD